MTGGGSSVISELLAVPGSSATLLDAQVPYDAKALSRLLGGKPESACSSLTARQLAMGAFEHGVAMAGNSDQLAGLGITAALATDRGRRGRDRCHLALQTKSTTLDLTVPLDKSASRAEQEAICKQAAFILISRAAGLDSQLPDDWPIREFMASPKQQELLQAKLTYYSQDSAPSGIKAIFPGSFNPYHDGHAKMLTAARAILNRKVFCEISIKNVDKPSLDFMEMHRRKRQFNKRLYRKISLVFSNAPTFRQKSSLFPQAVFVVGLDTIVRVDDPAYYAGQVGKDESLQQIADQGCRFLVFGRLHEGRFQTLDDISLSPALASLCQGVPEASFRVDISSSQIRANRLSRAQQDQAE